MPSISVVLGHYIFTIPPEGYTESNFYEKCIVLISTRDDLKAMNLGYAFMHSFLITYKYDRGKIALSLNTNAPAGAKIET